ncbi:MAG TPA: restriction endonuclease subunit S [Polyangiaceae bacterium]|nr:restriction endonuclease subunit S [Polyangiaceae bacterium]
MTASLARPIASGWQWRALGDCAQLINGRAYAQHELLSLGTPVIRIQNLNGGDRWYYSDLSLPDDKYCSAGDLLFAWSASFGPYVWTGPRSIFHYHIWRVVPGNELDKGFAYHLLDWITAKVRAASHGVAMLHMTKGGMEAWQIPLPPLVEQRRIADVLDRAEALRTKRRAALAQLDTLTQSIFLDLFGGAESETWPLRRVEDLASTGDGSMRTGPFGSQLLHSEFTKTGIAVLGIDNVVSNEFTWGEPRFISPEKYRQLKRYTVHPGDVLISIMGTCGRCAVVPEDVPVAVNTKHLFCITLDQQVCSPLFLHAYFLRHPIARQYLEQTAKGAIMAGLNMGIIRKVPVRVPPLTVQETFASRIAAVENLKSAQRRSLAELNALFASLQHRAFRGEL